jgi:hypothetical protein
MDVAVTNSLNYHLNIVRGKATLHALLSSLTAVGLDVTAHQAEAELTTEGPDDFGDIATVSADTTFTDTRKVVLSLTSPLALLYATTLSKIRVHLMPNPINPWLLRIYRVPKP